MITRLRARFDGRVLVPEEHVDLPTDQVLELQVRSDEPNKTQDHLPTPPSKLDDFVSWAESLPPLADSPGDAAAQHDHYLYGTPKRKQA